MRISFLLYPTKKVKVDEDSSFWIYRELALRGHRVSAFLSSEMFWDRGVLRAPLTRYQTKRASAGYVFASQEEPSDLSEQDVIFIRKEPPFDNEYLTALQLLIALREKVFILNDPEGIALCNEKLFILDFPQFLTDTCVTSDRATAQKFIRSLKCPAVIKPLNLKGGSEIIRVGPKDPDLVQKIEAVTHDGQRAVMFQRYIEHSVQGDKRILLLNGRYLGSFVRRAGKNDFRANLSLGGTFHAARIDRREERMIDALAPALIARGLYFVGLDVIRGYLSEVNVTSPSGLPEIRLLEKKRLEKEIADFIERRA